MEIQYNPRTQEFAIRGEEIDDEQLLNITIPSDTKILTIQFTTAKSINEFIDRNFENLQNVIEVNIIDNYDIEELPELPASVERIQANDRIKVLPQNLPPKLKILDLNGATYLKHLPETLPDTLQELKFWSTDIKTLPNILPENLRLLEIPDGNQIKYIPPTTNVKIEYTKLPRNSDGSYGVKKNNKISK